MEELDRRLVSEFGEASFETPTGGKSKSALPKSKTGGGISYDDQMGRTSQALSGASTAIDDQDSANALEAQRLEKENEQYRKTEERDAMTARLAQLRITNSNFKKSIGGASKSPPSGKPGGSSSLKSTTGSVNWAQRLSGDSNMRTSDDHSSSDYEDESEQPQEVKKLKEAGVVVLRRESGVVLCS